CQERPIRRCWGHRLRRQLLLFRCRSSRLNLRSPFLCLLYCSLRCSPKRKQRSLPPPSRILWCARHPPNGAWFDSRPLRRPRPLAAANFFRGYDIEMPSRRYLSTPIFPKTPVVIGEMKALTSPIAPDYCLPTKVVTDCAAKEPEKRPADTVMAVSAAKLALADVT